MSKLVIARSLGDFEALLPGPRDLRVAAGVAVDADRTVMDYVGDGHRVTDLDAVRWLKELGHSPIAGGPCLHERLQFGGTSLWWLMEGEIYRQILREATQWIAWVGEALRRESPSALAIVDDGSVAVKVALAMAKVWGVETQPFVRNIVSNQTNVLRWQGIALRTRDLLRRGAAGRIGALGQAAHPRILAASMSREQVSIDPRTGARFPEDLVLAPVFEKLANECASVGQLYKFPYRSRIRVPRTLRRHRVVVPWEAYVDAAAAHAITQEETHLRDLWETLRTDTAFTGAWQYGALPLWDIVVMPLAKVWQRIGALAARYLTLADRVLDVEQPDVLLVASETSVDNKALLARTNQRGIPSVAVQHGTIVAADDYLADYSHLQSDLTATPSKADLYAEVTCLFGDEVRRVMVDGIGYAYPERLKAIGQPRFDKLLQLPDTRERENFFRAYGLIAGRKTVLIGSQTFNIAGNRDQFFKAVFRAFEEASNIQIVVKPHPVESPAYHRRLAKRMGVAVTVLPPNVDMQQAIRACDVLVTSYSTVAVEAMIAGKPVVTVNLTGLPDIVPFAREGAAVGVHNPEEIRTAITRALDDTVMRERLVAMAHAYVAREMAGCDGGATKRVVDLTLSMAASQP